MPSDHEHSGHKAVGNATPAEPEPAPLSAAIAGVESLAHALNDGLGREGRVILGGDASFSLIHRPLSADERRFFEHYGSLSTITTTRATTWDATASLTITRSTSWDVSTQAGRSCDRSCEG